MLIFYLWKIFDDRDSKCAFERMCGQRINDLTEYELQNIAKLKEECAKKNKIKDMKKYMKEFNKNYKEQKKKYSHTHKEQQKKYCEIHKEEKREYDKKYRETHKEEIEQLNHTPCHDPIKNDECNYQSLKQRKYRNKELYKNINIKDCIIKV